MGKCKVCGEEVLAGIPELADDTYYCSTDCIKEVFQDHDLDCEDREVLSKIVFTPDEKVRTKKRSHKQLFSQSNFQEVQQ